MNNVAAVVVTYQSAGVLQQCLRALSPQVDRVIVVDNASTDTSCDIARAEGAELIRRRTNEGYGFANNRGVEAASGSKWCLIVNPDAILQEGCVAALMDAASRKASAAILVPRLVEPDGRVFFRSESVLSEVTPAMPAMATPPRDEAPIAFASGACMLLERSRFVELGGFDEAIFLYYEDDDLSLRARRAGFEIVYVDKAIAHHLRGKSSEIERGTIFRSRYHLAWSRSYIARKYHLSDDNVRVLMQSGTKYVGAFLTQDRMRIERYGGSLAGAWAALRGRPAIRRESAQ